MCRALLYLGEPVLLDDLLFKPDSALVKQAYMPRMSRMLNLAGFGMMAWDRSSVEPDFPYSYGTTNLPVFDRNLKSLANKVKANCFLGHVRGVAMDSVATISEQNIHPFWYPGTKFVLAHNGDLHHFSAMRDDLRQYIDAGIAKYISGTTDSEWIYALFLSQLDDPSAYSSIDELRRAIDQTLSIIATIRARHGISVSSSTNLFISDGRQIASVRFCFDFGCYPITNPGSVHEASLNYVSLWYTSGGKYGFYDDEWQMIGGPGVADSIMVASEPLTKDAARWLEVPEYSILHAQWRNGSTETNTYYVDV